MTQPTHWHVDLAEAAATRRDQTSFHVFAENQHSDVRGQLYNVAAGEALALWTDAWPRHLFIVLVVVGTVEAKLEEESVPMGPLSQLVVLPRTPCELAAISDATVEIISLLSSPPRHGDTA